MKRLLLRGPGYLKWWTQTCLILLAGFLLLWPNTAAAAGVIDQKQESWVDMDVNVNNTYYSAQTFKPGVSGRLEGVSVGLYRLAGSGAGFRDVIVQIKEGLPDGSGTVLATGTVTVTSADNTNTWYAFPLSANPVLTQGNWYSIVVTAPGTPNTGLSYVWWGDDASPVDRYPNGEMWNYNAGWTKWTGFDASDIAFRTYMTPNTPPTVATNTGVTVAEGGTATIAATNLRVADAESAASQLTITVDTVPVKGELRKNGTKLNAISTFTQADIDNGNITYAHNGDESTSDSFIFSVADPMGASLSNQTFNITVSPTNDAPTLANVPAPQTAYEESNTTITGISTADVDLGANALSVSLSASHGTLTLGSTTGLTFTSGGNGQAAMTFTGMLANVNTAIGSFAYRGATDYNGADSISLTVSDQGASGAGGAKSASATIPVTVNGVNDAPSFTKGGNQTVAEDSGAQSVPGWATSISAGPGEGSQTLTFSVTGNTNPTLFSAGPAVAANGTLTYTPAANANGSATVTIQLSDNGGTANGGADTSAAQTFTITVTPVNDPPSFSGSGDVTLLEDAGPAAVAHWATSLSAGPADEAGQNLTLSITGNTKPALFAVQPAIAADGGLTFTPAPNANGTAAITVQLADDGGGSNTSAQSFNIVVTAVNDAPSFTKGGNQTVAEDAGAQTVAGWATAISAGPSDESTQTLTFTVGNDNNGLFSVQPAVAANGTLTYTPAANATGVANVAVQLTDNGGTANSGADTSSLQSFSITVTAVNDAPSISGLPPTLTAYEDTDAAFSVGIADIDAGAGLLSVDVSVQHGTINLATVAGLVINGGANGSEAVQFDGLLASVNTALSNLTYRADPDYSGADTLSLSVSDQGNTGGGVLTASGTTAITVVAVNDAPFFTPGANQTVAEDAGAQTVAAWATGMAAGPADEAGQTLSFVVTNDKNALFAVQPAVAADGTLTYTPAADANGTATVSVRLADNGGTAHGGTDTSLPQTFTINVTAVNDPPSFTKGADVNVLEDAGAPVANWATAINKGPADEVGQALTFTVTNDNNALFAVQPAVAADGTLTYTLAADAHGQATVSVYLSDNGGGTDRSATQTFTITVSAVNDAPSFTKGANPTVAEDAGAQTVPNWATAISAGPADEAAQTLTFTVTNNNHPLFGVQPAISADGTLTYTPAPDANGSATVSVYVTDNGGGTDTSATQTFTITVSAVNDAPSFTKGANQNRSEDDPAQAVAGWATNMSAGPADEAATQTLTFTVTNDNNALFAVQPAISPTGTLTYTLAPNANGSATVSVTLSDNSGGTETSATETFTINVVAANDSPVISGAPGALTAYEDRDQLLAGISIVDVDIAAADLAVSLTVSHGTVTLAGEAGLTYQSGGSGQSAMTFTGALASVNAALANLTYRALPEYNGPDTLALDVSDQGNTGAGGTKTANAVVLITVTAVNDAPYFTLGPDPDVLEEAGAQTEAGWATGISAGPADEGAQTLTFTVTNDNNALFAVQPAIAADGTLTYTPAANISGSATVTVTLKDNGGTANGGADTSAADTFTISVTAVNDQPSFTKGANKTVLEDAGAQSFAGWATAISAGAANESAQVLTFTVTNDNNGLFAVEPAVAADGTLTFTPAANANGSATVTLYLSDDGGTANGGADTSANQTFTITVTAVNDAPAFTKGADVIVNEDTGAYTGAGWVTAISAGPADESAQTLAFTVTNNDNALFTVQPALDATGQLTFTPAPDMNGVATVTVVLKDNGGTANGGADTSAAQTFTVTVTAVNDAPSFTKGADLAVLEDAGAQTAANWATAIFAGPANESGQTLAFTVTNDNNALFTVQPAVSPTGTLTYTPAANANGVATVTAVLKDNGGTANDGVDTAASQTFTITVTPVNDAPAFTKGANQAIDENAPAQTVAGWATGISAGSADEAGQVLSFNVTNNNNALFTVQPAIDPATGTLTYTPAASANGVATVTVTLNDDGGTANSGADTSAPQTFTITIAAINDAPSYTKGADQTVLEDAGAQTAANWATAISAGPANESTQALTFTVTTNNNALFSVQPAIDPTTGTLTYTLAPNANGVATVTVVLKDNGGTANGGTDSSAAQTFTITVTPVNDMPSFTKGADQTALEDAGARTAANWATAISAGHANEFAQTLSFTVTNDSNALFAVQPAIDAATGALTYTPAANANGVARVTVVLKDDGGTANGGADTTAAQTFTITVTAVNDAPTFTKGADLAFDEDAAAQTVNGWATAMTAGPADEGTQTLTFTVTNSNNALFSVQPAIDATTGTLTYTPASHAFGVATVTAVLRDNGGTANSGVDTSAAQTFTITVNGINDGPSFTKGADLTVLEDAGAQTAANWATAISAGPANEAAQVLTFTVTNDDNALFSVQPAISGTGTLTYTPAANANGVATVTVVLKDDGGTANGGVDTTAAQTFTITVTPVNDAPSFTKGANVTVNEDAAAYTEANWATAINAGPADEVAQTLTFTVTNDKNVLFAVQPALAADGTLTYTLAPDANGSATVTVILTDNGGTANGGADLASQTFTIAVTAVNDAPSFTKGANQTVDEDAAAQSVAGWATGISAGPADEALQAPTFTVTNDKNALFAVQPAVSMSGTLTYTLAPDANGSVTVTVVLKDNGGTANGGADTSAAQTFTITVTAVNDAPSFTKGADVTVDEDAAAQSLAGWATAISAGPANEAGQSLTFTVTNDNNALFAVQPAVALDGTLTYTLAPDANRTANVTVLLQDDGGTANGGADAVTQTFTITVTAVNDAPSFTKGADQTLLEDAAAQSVANWATAISSGPANEVLQALAFTVTNDNNALFAVQPAVTSDGTLTYTLAADANGSAIVSVYLGDNGGGTNTSATETFTVSVTAVNDAPSFTKGADQALMEDAAVTPAANWATAISAGPADEAAQTLTFTVTNDNNALFAVQPAVAADGTLTYTLAPNANGSATVTVSLADNGGTANGGSETTAAQTFTVTVAAVNDAPAFTGAPENTNQAVYLNEGLLPLAATDVEGDTPQFSITSGTLPAGISLNLDGTFTGVANAVGAYPVVVGVTDGHDATTGDLTITVSRRPDPAPVNQPPVFTGPTSITIAEGEGLPGLSATDPEGQSVTFSRSGGSLPAGITLGSDGSFTGTTNYQAAGNYSISVVVRDALGATGSGQVQITVTNTDTNPTLGSLPDQTNVEGDEVTLGLTASDLDGDTLSFRALGLPPGLHVNPVTGSITGKIAVKAAGTYQVTVSVADHTPVGGREHVATGSFTWKVEAGKGPKPRSINGVVMENGRPVAGARVNVAEDFDGDGVIDFVAEVVTGPDGRYVIEVPQGHWVYKAQVELPAQTGGAPLRVTQTAALGDPGATNEGAAADRVIAGQVLMGNGATGGTQPSALPPGFTTSAALRDQTGRQVQGIQIQNDGSYQVAGVQPGTYQIVVQLTAPNGRKLAGGVATATVTESGALVLSNVLIDPYGIVTDTATGRPIEGVKVRLMWADTPANRAQDRTAGTEVQLPALENFPPANNAEPQWTDAKGTYAWMVYADGDYYLLAEKDGYFPYDSRQEGRDAAAAPGEDSYVAQGVIHVGQTVVHFDFSMKPRRGVHKPYVNGFPDGTFQPDRPLTRAEAATILARLMDPAPATGPAAKFGDVADTHWASRSIAVTAALGLMKGDPDGRFRPDDQLTRAEIAVIIGRLKKLPGQPGEAFADTRGHWAEPAIKALQAAAIMQGLPDGTFQPERAVTRAEFVTVLNRSLGRGATPGSERQIFPDVPVTHWASGQIMEAATDHAFEIQADGTEQYTTP